MYQSNQGQELCQAAVSTVLILLVMKMTPCLANTHAHLPVVTVSKLYKEKELNTECFIRQDLDHQEVVLLILSHLTKKLAKPDHLA